MRRLGAALLLLLLLRGESVAQELPFRGFLQGVVSGRVADPEPCPPSQATACRKDLLVGDVRLQVEGARSVGPLGLFGKAELIYDGVDGEADVDLRETYLDLRRGLLDLRLGRQVITWGLGDLIFINDVFPKDRVAFLSGLPLEYLKKGSDALSITASPPFASLQVVGIPRFEPDTFPQAGGRLRFFDPLGEITARRTDEPFAPFEKAEVAARLFRNLSGWDLALYAYRGYSRLPGAEVEPGPRLRFFFPRLNTYGASGQGSLLGGVVSLEAGYYDSAQDRQGRNPGIENSQVRTLVGYQREVIPDLTLGAQSYTETMLDHGAYLRSLPPGFPRRPGTRHVLTLRATQFLYNQTLRLGLFALWSPNEEDCYVNPEVKYNVTDALWGALGVNLFGGPRRTEFGQFEENSNVYLVVRYAF